MRLEDDRGRIAAARIDDREKRIRTGELRGNDDLCGRGSEVFEREGRTDVFEPVSERGDGGAWKECEHDDRRGGIDSNLHDLARRGRAEGITTGNGADADVFGARRLPGEERRGTGDDELPIDDVLKVRVGCALGKIAAAGIESLRGIPADDVRRVRRRITLRRL